MKSHKKLPASQERMDGTAHDDQPALWTAAKEGQTDQVLHLLADIDEKGEPLEFTPLHAVRLHHKDTVRALLQHGADVTARDPAGATPLHSAVDPGCDDLSDVEVVRQLLEHGADVISRQWRYRTPLHIAAFNGYPLAVELLFEQGSNLSHTYELFQRPPWSLKDSLGDTPLHTAAGKGHKVVVKMLLSHGADINATGKINSPWETALMKAAYMEQTYMVRLLLKHGADVTSNNVVSVDARDQKLHPPSSHMARSYPAAVRSQIHWGPGHSM